MKGSKAIARMGAVALASFVVTLPGFGYTVAPPASQISNARNSQQGGPDSVSPGTINYIEGQASLDGRSVSAARITMQPGQILQTGNGYAEVLLTPGAFLRVGHNSEIHLIASGLADTRVQLDRGSAMIEVDDLIKGTHLGVAMDGASVQLEKKGLYDFDANQQAVKVVDGKANIEAVGKSKTIGKGDQFLLASGKTTGFDIKSVKQEPLYVWSEARSQAESQANTALAQNIYVYGGWYGPGWYWDPFWDFYAFVPGGPYLYSPFGWGFYSPWFIGYYRVPAYHGWYGHGWWHGHPGWRGAPVAHGPIHGTVHGFQGAFHGGFGGFHGGMGGFHGGGRHR